MFENLPQVSQAVIDAIGQQEIANSERLEESEKERLVEDEIIQLKLANDWIGSAVETIIYTFQHAQELLDDEDCPKDAREFWEAVAPVIRTYTLKLTLALLKCIDQSLWAKEMEVKIDVKETVNKYA